MLYSPGPDNPAVQVGERQTGLWWCDLIKSWGRQSVATLETSDR